MSNRDWLFQVPRFIERKDKAHSDSLPLFDKSLSEFRTMRLVVEVYSEALLSTIWFCSNDDMALFVKSDRPEAITYTSHELIEIIYLNPRLEDIKRIHEVKSAFPNCKIIYSTTHKEKQ